MTTQDDILRILIQHQGSPLSGQALANQLGLSRNAIWKAVEALRQQGYDIQSQTKKGYQLMALTQELDAQLLKQQLPDDLLPLHIEVAARVTSTNDLAKHFAIQAPGQAGLFIAQEQTQGRGRSGRHFHSQLAHGLYLSYVFQPPQDLSLQDLPQYTLVAASAMVKVLEPLLSNPLAIKWVNDLFYRGRKVGGILTEATTDIENQQLSSLIIGIGLNLAGDFQTADHQTQQVAGTLFGQSLPSNFNPNQLIRDFLLYFHTFAQELSNKTYLSFYQDHLLGIGHQVTYDYQGTQYTGLIQGINDQGHLLVQDPYEVTQALFSQEVHFASQQFTQFSDSE